MVALTNPAGLTNYVTAVHGRDRAPVKILVIDDSTGEGTAATTFLDRWQYLLQQGLRANLPTPNIVTPGIGYIPALTVPLSPAPPVTTSGSPGTHYGEHGLGMKRYRVDNTQYVQWNAQQCDAVRIHYGKSTVAGSAIISIDAVDQTPQPSSAAGANGDGFYWDSPALTPGSHTVKVRGTSAFSFVLEACEFYNGDKDAGIRVYDSAHYGATSTTLLTANADFGQWQAVAALKPQLIIYGMGLNDLAGGYAAYLTNVDTTLSKIATAMGTNPYSVLLFSKYRPVKSTLVDPVNWAAMQEGLRTRATGFISHYNLQEDWPVLQAGGATSAGLMYESDYPLHPNSAGHARIASLLTQALTPTFAALPAGSYLDGQSYAYIPRKEPV